MATENSDKRLMVRCTQMYYEENLSQVNISEKLGISKSTVSRILRRAKESGIVQFIVNNPFDHDYLELEKALEHKYKLNEVVIVEEQANDEQLKETLAMAAAKYLERIVKTHYRIGVTWGTTVSKISKYIEVNRDYEVTVFPLTGGLGSATAEIHPNQIASRIAQQFGTTAQLLHAPGMVKSLSQKETFINEKSIADILDEYNDLDVILSGIGSPALNTSTMLATNYYSPQEMKELVNKGATADVATLMLDNAGRWEPFSSNDRIIGISLDQIKHARYSIGIAGGVAKLNAIKAVLKGHYFGVLIIDSLTAQELIR